MRVTRRLSSVLIEPDSHTGVLEQSFYSRKQKDSGHFRALRERIPQSPRETENPADKLCEKSEPRKSLEPGGIAAIRGERICISERISPKTLRNPSKNF